MLVPVKEITLRKEGNLWLIEEEKGGIIYQRPHTNKAKAWQGILDTNPGTELIRVLIPLENNDSVAIEPAGEQPAGEALPFARPIHIELTMTMAEWSVVMDRCFKVDDIATQPDAVQKLFRAIGRAKAGIC